MSTVNLSEKELNELSKETLIELAISLQSSITDLTNTVNNLSETIKVMNQRKYGRKSETVSALQLSFDFGLNEVEAVSDKKEPEPEAEKVVPKRTRPKGKRAEDLKKITEHRDVPVDISEEKLIEEFGENGWKRLPDQLVTKLEHKPAVFEAVTYHLAVYVSKKEDKIIHAERPVELWQNSIATPSLLSSIITAKYINGVPLYRQEQRYNENNVFINRTNMANWVIKASQLYLQPYYQGLKAKMMNMKYLHADETPVLVSKDGRDAGTKSYMWVYRTRKGRGDPEIVLYDYQKTRSYEHPERFLSDFSGTLITDGYSTYHKLEKEHPDHFTVAGCWVHLKRKFTDYVKSLGNKKAKGTLAEKAIKKIQKIFHEDGKLENVSSEERLKVREKDITALVDDFFDWVRNHSVYIDSASQTGKAFTYALNQEQYLRTFLNDPEVPMHNNAAEQSIRPFTVGRKNWVMIDTINGAEASAVMYSIAETAKANQLRPYEYFTYLLTELPKYIHDFNQEIPEDLYPWSEKFPKELFKNNTAVEK